MELYRYTLGHTSDRETQQDILVDQRIEALSFVEAIALAEAAVDAYPQNALDVYLALLVDKDGATVWERVLERAEHREL